MSEFYTANGWKGNKYDSKLSVKEIAKIVREELKKKFPKCKFSVTSPHHSSLDINLMSAPFEALKVEGGQRSVNQYYIDRDEDITEEAREVMKYVKDFVQDYNFDDSDSMTDYFHTNFYLHLGIGKWDKHFEVK
jgi:hypothetical protein